MQSAINIDGLCFGYTSKNAHQLILNQLSLSFEPGQLTCLLGANGAGKTTLINLLLGRLTSQQGSIGYFEQQLDIKDVRQRIGAMLQDSSAPERATPFELLTLFSSYYPNPVELSKLIKQLGLTPILNQQFGRLSGGQKQLVLLALALCANPDILFLDEPSVGMDVATRRILWQVIEQYKQLGKTIILTTHYLEEADALADRIVVLHQGKITADGTPAQLKSQFAQKTIRAKSHLTQQQITALAQVISLTTCGGYIEVVTGNAAATLKHWLTLEPALEDISITNADLEQAFLQITSTDTTKPLAQGDAA